MGEVCPNIMYMVFFAVASEPFVGFSFDGIFEIAYRFYIKYLLYVYITVYMYTFYEHSMVTKSSSSK